MIGAAQNSGSSSSSSNAFSAGVGVAASVNSQGGGSAGINVNANASGSESESQYVSHQNAVIVAGDNLSTTSGRDTTIAGVHLEADHVQMDVGRDLTVSSVQDSASSENSSWNAGVSVTINPAGGAGSSASINLGGGSGESQSNWVGEQTAILGHESVDIYVEEHTHLEGAIIATDPGGDLRLDTGTISYAEIQDNDESRNTHGGISINTGPVENQIDHLDSVELQHSSQDREGVLRATITEGEIIVRNDPDLDLSGLNRELDQAREITKDERVNVDVYVDPAAIREVLHRVDGITSSLEEYAKFLEKILGIEVAPEEVPRLVDELLALLDEYADYIAQLIEEGWTLEQVLEMRRSDLTPEFIQEWKGQSLVDNEGQNLVGNLEDVIEKVKDMTPEERKKYIDIINSLVSSGLWDNLDLTDDERTTLEFLGAAITNTRMTGGQTYAQAYLNDDLDNYTYDDVFGAVFKDGQTNATDTVGNNLINPENIKSMQQSISIYESILTNKMFGQTILKSYSAQYGMEMTEQDALNLFRANALLNVMSKDAGSIRLVPMKLGPGDNANGAFNRSTLTISLNLDHLSNFSTNTGELMREIARITYHEVTHYYQFMGTYDNGDPYPEGYYDYLNGPYLSSKLGEDHYKNQPSELHTYAISDYLNERLALLNFDQMW